MAKFKVGDRARYVARSNNAVGKCIEVGSIVVIQGVNVIVNTTEGRKKADYVIECRGHLGGVNGWQLEPIIDLGSWDELQKTINWNPTKEVSHVE